MNPLDRYLQYGAPKRGTTRVRLDLETTGLGTHSWFPSLTQRGAGEPVGIMEISAIVEKHGRRPTLLKGASGFTNILDELGFTREILARMDPNAPPEAMLNTLVYQAKGKAGRFDQALLDPDGVLRTIISTHIKAARGHTMGDLITDKATREAMNKLIPGALELSTEFKSPTSRIRALVAHGLMQAQTGNIEWAAHNIGFDIDRLSEAVHHSGDAQLKRMWSALTTHQNFKIADTADPLKQAIMDRMIHSDYIPSYLDRGAIAIALEEGKKKGEILKAVAAGDSTYVAKATAIRELMDDVKGYSVNKDIFKARLRERRVNYEFAKSIIPGMSEQTYMTIEKEMLDHLHSIGGEANTGKGLGALRRATSSMRNHSQHSGLLKAMLDKAYNPNGVYGSLIPIVKGIETRMTDSLKSALDFISGWKQGPWLQSLGIGTVEGGHTAIIDNIFGGSLSSETQQLIIEARGGNDPASTQARKRLYQAIDHAALTSKLGQAEGILAGMPISKAAIQAAANVDPMSKGAIGPMGGRGFWLKATAIAAGAYLLSDWTREEQEIPGLRYASTGGGGITPSGDRLLGDFGSGRDQLYQLLSQDPNVSYISAGQLGYRGDRLRGVLQGNISPFLEAAAERGTHIHEIIEKMYLSSGAAIAAEYFLSDPHLGVSGRADLLLPSGIPLELKTVEDYDALMNLKAPKEPHISQANFYAYALNKPYAMIGYAARNNPNQIKYFKVEVDTDRLYNDVAAVRAMMRVTDTQAQLRDIFRPFRHGYNLAKQGLFTPDFDFEWSAMHHVGQLEAMRSLGDYTKHNVQGTYRQEQPRTDTSNCTGGSKVRNQGAKAFVQGHRGKPKATVNGSREHSW